MLFQSGPAEAEIRLELAACYRIFHMLGWTELIFNHITAKVPGPEEHFLINPYGLWYDEVTASNLVKIDLDGNPVGDDTYGVNEAGFIIHSAIHANVPAAQCVMHTHTREGIAVACKRDGLSNTNFYSAMIWNHVAYHDFEGLTVRPDECPRLVASIGDRPLVILRNHGLLSHGRTVEEAFARLWTLQLACETQLATDAMTGETLPVSDEATEHSTRDGRLFSTNDGEIGMEMFAALQRVVDARDPSYRM